MRSLGRSEQRAQHSEAGAALLEEACLGKVKRRVARIEQHRGAGGIGAAQDLVHGDHDRLVEDLVRNVDELDDGSFRLRVGRLHSLHQLDAIADEGKHGVARPVGGVGAGCELDNGEGGEARAQSGNFQQGDDEFHGVVSTSFGMTRVVSRETRSWSIVIFCAPERAFHACRAMRMGVEWTADAKTRTSFTAWPRARSISSTLKYAKAAMNPVLLSPVCTNWIGMFESM